MDSTNENQEGRDAIQPPVREDAVQGDVRDVAAEGVGQDVSPFRWSGDWMVLKETEQVVGELMDFRGLYLARAYSVFSRMWTESTIWATRQAAMAAVEKRFMECNR